MRKLKLFFITVIATIVLNTILIFLIVSKSSASIKDQQLSLLDVKTGDLILRNGKGIISDLFRKSSLHDKTYSHAGLILKENNQVYVVHCYQDSDNPGIVKEKLSDFASKDRCSIVGIYRYQLSNDEQSRLEKQIKVDLNARIKFDDKFELGGNDYYCTEWVRKVVNESMKDTNYICVTKIEGYNYIAPDNLYLNKNIRTITKIKIEYVQ